MSHLVSWSASDTQAKYKIFHLNQGSWYELNSLHRLSSVWEEMRTVSFLKASALSTHECDSKSSSINCPGALHPHLVTDHWIFLCTILSCSRNVIGYLRISIRSKKATNLCKCEFWIAGMPKAASNECLFSSLSLWKGIWDLSGLPLPEVAYVNGIPDGTRRRSCSGFLSFSLTSVAWC